MVVPLIFRETYLGNGVLNDLLIRHVALVPDQQLIDTFGSVTINLLKPLLDVVERIHVRHIVDDTDAVGTTIVGRGNRAETFLTSGVPLVL